MFKYLDFQRKKGKHCEDDIKLFGLSTCVFCKRAINFLEENEIEYDLVYMDKIDSELKKRTREEFKVKFNERMSFPSLVLNEIDYQIGFIRVAWERMFSSKSTIRKHQNADNPGNVVTDISKFVDTTAEYKYWYVNPNNEFRNEIEEGLLLNYKKYGFYHCPCRDSDSTERSRDITCPCHYAEDDIKEWGQCYCGLYVSKTFHENRTELGSIPERRQ